MQRTIRLPANHGRGAQSIVGAIVQQGNQLTTNEPRVSQGTYAPGAPKEYMDAKMTNGKDGKFSTHLGLAGMPRRSGLNTDKTRSKASADPTAWGYHSLSNF